MGVTLHLPWSYLSSSPGPACVHGQMQWFVPKQVLHWFAPTEANADFQGTKCTNKEGVKQPRLRPSTERNMALCPDTHGKLTCGDGENTQGGSTAHSGRQHSTLRECLQYDTTLHTVLCAASLRAASRLLFPRSRSRDRVNIPVCKVCARVRRMTVRE